MQLEGSRGQIREAMGATAGNLCCIKKTRGHWKTLGSFSMYKITLTAVLETWFTRKAQVKVGRSSEACSNQTEVGGGVDEGDISESAKK